MPHSSTNSLGEDVELPDAPQAPTEETESRGNSPPPKLEFHSDAAEPAPAPQVKKERGDGEGGAKLEDTPADDSDEDLLDDDDVADLLASEIEIVPTNVKPSSHSLDRDEMITFYRRLFPFQYLFKWLNHSEKPSKDFSHREFAFTLQNDAYLRYQSFPDHKKLREKILELNPSRFEIGPVYNAKPQDRKSFTKGTFFALAKELVFDIDLTDYDEIRTCCDKANICIKCWQFITVAIKILDSALRDDLGFNHILWVYSGRRGAHAWVCDKRARVMDDTKRRAVASYLEVVRGGSQVGKKVNVKRPLHPHLARSFDILRNRFESDILQNQDPWRDTKEAEKLLTLLPDRALNDALRKKWESQDNRPSMLKWADIDAMAEIGVSEELKGKLQKTQLKEHKQDVILEYMYPRLDVEVSRHLNHLLKSPFCVHPGTGRVCVPIDSRNPEQFDPMAVPTVTGLITEVNAWERENRGDERKKDYEKTSLKPYIDLFRRFVTDLVNGEMTAKREREADEGGNSMEF